MSVDVARPIFPAARVDVGQFALSLSHPNLVSLGKLGLNNFYRFRYLLYCLRCSLLRQPNRLPNLSLQSGESWQAGS